MADDRPDYFDWEWRIWQAEIGAGEKLLLLAIYRHYGKNDCAWPSVTRLADMTGDESSVRRRIKKLKEQGILKTEIRCKAGTRENATTMYTIVWDKLTTPGQNAPRSDDNPRAKCTSVPPGILPETPVQNAPLIIHRTVQEERGITPDPETGSKTPAHLDPLVLAAWGVIDRLWRETYPRRQQIRRTTLNAPLQAALAEYGHDAIVTGWRWVLTSDHDDAVWLRRKAGSLETLLHPNTGRKYVQAALDEQAERADERARMDEQIARQSAVEPRRRPLTPDELNERTMQRSAS